MQSPVPIITRIYNDDLEEAIQSGEGFRSSPREGFPDSIAFCHIDMNHPAPEAGALREVLPRLSKGGAIIFDDYGWWWYSAQKRALDPIARSLGQEILELPTGQGLLIKR